MLELEGSGRSCWSGTPLMTETVYRPSRDSSPLCRHDVPLSSCLTGRKKTHTKTNKQENKQNKTNCLFFKGNQISPSCVQDVVGRAHQSHAEALDARCWFFEPFRFHQAEPSQVTLWSVSTVNRGIQNPPPPPKREGERERFADKVTAKFSFSTWAYLCSLYRWTTLTSPSFAVGHLLYHTRRCICSYLLYLLELYWVSTSTELSCFFSVFNAATCWAYQVRAISFFNRFRTNLVSSARLGADLPACLHDHPKRSPQLGDVFWSEEIGGCLHVVGTCYPSREIKLHGVCCKGALLVRFTGVLFSVCNRVLWGGGGGVPLRRTSSMLQGIPIRISFISCGRPQVLSWSWKRVVWSRSACTEWQMLRVPVNVRSAV